MDNPVFCVIPKHYVKFLKSPGNILYISILPGDYIFNTYLYYTYIIQNSW